jgi:hypothetical protein
VIDSRIARVRGGIAATPAGAYSPAALARPLLLLIVALLAGCAAAGTGTRVFGVVVGEDVTGELLLDMRGTLLRLTGTPGAIDQLSRLGGARVAIQGRASASGVHARQFELLEAPDGMVPHTGILIVDQSGVMLADELSGARLALRSSELALLKRQHGARLWVTGSLVGPQLLLIAHWGVLIDAP